MKGYVFKAMVIQDQFVEELLFSFVRSTTLFKNAEDYVQAKDTYHVESFNNSMLIYLDKRMHHLDNTYNLRQGLALLEWNEHVGRHHTPTYSIEVSRHPDRQSGKN